MFTLCIYAAVWGGVSSVWHLLSWWGLQNSLCLTCFSSWLALCGTYTMVYLANRRNWWTKKTDKWKGKKKKEGEGSCRCGLRSESRGKEQADTSSQHRATFPFFTLAKLQEFSWKMCFLLEFFQQMKWMTTKQFSDIVIWVFSILNWSSLEVDYYFVDQKNGSWAITYCRTQHCMSRISICTVVGKNKTKG